MNRALLFLLYGLLLQSCSLYKPTTLIPTGFEKKGDIHLSLSSSAFDALAIKPLAHSNIAYSPVDYIYLHAEGVIGASPFQKNLEYNYSGGIGFYYPINEKFQIETQLSIGKGKFDWGDPFSGSSDSFTLGEGDYSHQNGFIAFNYKVSDVVTFGLAYRHNQVLVNYRDANVFYLKNISNHVFQDDFFLFIRENDKSKTINFFNSIGLGLNAEDFDYYPYNRIIYVNVGLLFNLN